MMKKLDSPAAFIGVSGDGIISFGSGQPDLLPPPEIFEGLHIPRAFKYGLVQGNDDLRAALAMEYASAKATADEFVITNGASGALDLTFRALYQMYGKAKVLVCRPYYYSYPPIIEFAGHTPVYTDLIDGQMDLQDVLKKMSKVKAILINSPSNPTGRVEKLETLKRIEKEAARLGVYVISDEVYKDLIYERDNYLIQGKRVITINSFSKTYSMCGLRVGYLWSHDRKLVQQVIDMKVHTSMNTNVLGQEMALRATRVPEEFINAQTAVWRERRDTIYEGLKELGFDLWKPEGAFYVLPRIKNSNKVVRELFEKHKVIVYDGSWFGAEGRIRLSYALELPKIQEGLARIGQYLKGKESWLK